MTASQWMTRFSIAGAMLLSACGVQSNGKPYVGTEGNPEDEIVVAWDLTRNNVRTSCHMVHAAQVEVTVASIKRSADAVTISLKCSDDKASLYLNPTLGEKLSDYEITAQLISESGGIIAKSVSEERADDPDIRLQFQVPMVTGDIAVSWTINGSSDDARDRCDELGIGYWTSELVEDFEGGLTIFGSGTSCAAGLWRTVGDPFEDVPVGFYTAHVKAFGGTCCSDGSLLVDKMLLIEVTEGKNNPINLNFDLGEFL